MPVFIVERYVPGLSLDAAWRWQARLRLAIAERRRDGTDIAHLGSTVVLGDETCCCRFDASSLDAVVDVNKRAGVPFARVLPALEIGIGSAAVQATQLPREAPRAGTAGGEDR